jgi:hypothetical protein
MHRRHFLFNGPRWAETTVEQARISGDVDFAAAKMSAHIRSHADHILRRDAHLSGKYEALGSPPA